MRLNLVIGCESSKVLLSPNSVKDFTFGTSVFIQFKSIVGNFTSTLYLGCLIVTFILLTILGVGTNIDFTCGIGNIPISIRFSFTPNSSSADNTTDTAFWGLSL